MAKEASSEHRSADTPFTLPPVMDGYPLEKAEKATIHRLLERYRVERREASRIRGNSATTPAPLADPPRPLST
jgi:hypothetical protein